eukprot:UN01444
MSTLNFSMETRLQYQNFEDTSVGLSSVFFQCDDGLPCDPNRAPVKTGLNIDCSGAVNFKDKCQVVSQNGYSCDDVSVTCIGGVTIVKGDCS